MSIYGVDDRKDLFELKMPGDNAIIQSADCVVSLFKPWNIKDNKCGTSTLKTGEHGRGVVGKAAAHCGV